MTFKPNRMDISVSIPDQAESNENGFTLTCQRGLKLTAGERTLEESQNQAIQRGSSAF